MLKRMLRFIVPLVLIARSAMAIPTCTINGVINDGAGNPVANGVVTFNTLFTQVVSGNTINQTLVSSTTDASGNLTPISLAQGVYVQITVNGGVPVTAIVPFANTITFAGLISNIVANPVLTSLAFVGQVSAPTCTSGSATIYFNSNTNRFQLDQNCGGYANILTTNSTDTVTNKSIDASEINSGVLAVANGGTNLSAALDDNIMIGNGTTWQSKAVPDCQDAGGNHLNYIASSNTVTCGNTSSGGGGGGSNPQTDATAILFNQADNTKLLRLDLSGLTTATTRVITVPNRNATLGTTTGTLTSGNLAKFDSSGNIVDDGIAIASLSGNTTKAATVSGALTPGNAVKSDASGNLVDAGVTTSGKTPLFASCLNPGTGTSFVPFGGDGNVVCVTQAQGQIPLPVGGTVKNLYCQTSMQPGASQSFIVTLQKGGTNQTLTCAVSGTNQTCNDTTHSFSVSAANLLGVQVVGTAGVPSTSLACGMELDPS